MTRCGGLVPDKCGSGGREQQHEHHAGDPAAHPRRGHPDSSRGHPRPQVTEPRAAGDDHDEDTLHPPPHLVRRIHLQDGLPVDGRDEVGSAGTREQHHGQPERMRKSRGGDEQAPGDHGADECDPLTAHPADPAGRQAADDGANRDRGVEPARRARPAEPLAATCGNSARGIANAFAMMSKATRARAPGGQR